MIGDVSRTRAVITASVLLSALAFGGCSDDEPQPKFAPPSSEPPTSAGTPSMSAKTDPGEAFVRSFFGFISDATQTGETSDFRDASSDRCANCQTLAYNIEQAFLGGNTVKGASWRVDSVTRAGSRAGGDVWNVDVSTSREKWYDNTGNLVRVVRPSTQEFAVLVKATAAGSQVADMRLRQ